MIAARRFLVRLGFGLRRRQFATVTNSPYRWSIPTSPMMRRLLSGMNQQALAEIRHIFKLQAWQGCHG